MYDAPRPSGPVHPLPVRVESYRQHLAHARGTEDLLREVLIAMERGMFIQDPYFAPYSESLLRHLQLHLQLHLPHKGRHRPLRLHPLLGPRDAYGLCLQREVSRALIWTRNEAPGVLYALEMRALDASGDWTSACAEKVSTEYLPVGAVRFHPGILPCEGPEVLSSCALDSLPSFEGGFTLRELGDGSLLAEFPAGDFEDVLQPTRCTGGLNLEMFLSIVEHFGEAMLSALPSTAPLWTSPQGQQALPMPGPSTERVMLRHSIGAESEL